MRQTLLRLRLDHLWSLDNQGNTLLVGVGFLLVPWALFGLYWAFRYVRSRPANELVAPIAVWLGIGAFILALPRLMSNVAAQGIPVYGYGFMLFVGFLLAAWNASLRARRIGLEADLVWDLAMWLIFPGIIGARLFYLIQYHERIFAGKGALESLGAAVNLADGGLVFYGSFLGGLAGFAAFCRLRSLRPLLLADLVVPSIFIGMAFGRIGCLLNGCCYGDACSLPWAVTFPEDSVPFVALARRGFLSPEASGTYPLHPTQIYSSLNALVLYALTAAVFHYRQREGTVVAVAWLAYPVTRFVIEFLRGDEPGRFGTLLTISQWVSLGLFVAGLLYLLWLWKWPARPDAARVSEPSMPASGGTS